MRWYYLIGPFLLAFFVGSCSKEKASTPSLSPPLVFYVDSVCITIPNVFTPNGDAINDFLVISGQNMASATLTVRLPYGGPVVYQDNGPFPMWDGKIGTNSTPIAQAYQIDVAVVDEIGTTYQGSSLLQVVTDNYSPCFSLAVLPVFGDRYDARNCGPVQQTADMICIQ